jgi:hypothetical protein
MYSVNIQILDNPLAFANLDWLDFAAKIVLIFVSITTLFVGYIKFVLEKGLIPPCEFFIACNTQGEQGNRKIIEALLHIKNLGNSVLIVRNLRIDILFFKDKNLDPMHRKDRRLNFPCSLKRCNNPYSIGIQEEHNERDSQRSANKMKNNQNKKRNIGVPVIEYDTFVLPGVDQVYTFITSIPKSASFVRVEAEFCYPGIDSIMARFLLWFAHKMGLINYTLKSITEPHTCERVFDVRKKKILRKKEILESINSY